MAEPGQHESREGDSGNATKKVPQEAVKVVLMPDGGYAVAVEVRLCDRSLSACRVTSDLVCLLLLALTSGHHWLYVHTHIRLSQWT